MCPRSRFGLAACVIATTLGAPAARAQWAVVDVQAIGQLVQQLQTMKQQFDVAQAQLLEARQELKSTMGGRGMEQLLAGTVRNYLPTDWAELTNALTGSGTGSPLAANVRSTLAANAVLSSRQLAVLSLDSQQEIGAARQSAALRQALAQQALANVSGRFAAIQSLIAAISGAADQKAILDLQTRIGAELGMLQNEHTKLQVLAQASEALESASMQRAREQAIIDQGRFESRFEPTP